MSLRRDGKKARCTIDIDTFAAAMWKKTLLDKRRPLMLARRHLECACSPTFPPELRFWRHRGGRLGFLRNLPHPDDDLGAVRAVVAVVLRTGRSRGFENVGSRSFRVSSRRRPQPSTRDTRRTPTSPGGRASVLARRKGATGAGAIELDGRGADRCRTASCWTSLPAPRT